MIDLIVVRRRNGRHVLKTVHKATCRTLKPTTEFTSYVRSGRWEAHTHDCKICLPPEGKP